MSRLVVTGASGQLGAYLLAHLSRLAEQVVAFSGSDPGPGSVIPFLPVDLGDPLALERAFVVARPTLVIHAAALARVADCQHDPVRAQRINCDATAHLARLCADTGARLVFVSTDLVFAGDRAPYREDDPPCPLSVYGRSKARAEQAVLAHPGHVVARLSLLYGPSRAREPSFFDQQVAALRLGRPVTLFEDEWRTPLDLDTAAAALIRLAQGNLGGIVHLGGPERMSRLDMGRRLARFLALDPGVIRPARRDDVPAAEPRPCDTSLDSSRWRATFADLPWPGYEEALGRLLLSPGETLL